MRICVSLRNIYLNLAEKIKSISDSEADEDMFKKAVMLNCSVRFFPKNCLNLMNLQQKLYVQLIF